MIDVVGAVVWWSPFYPDAPVDRTHLRKSGAFDYAFAFPLILERGGSSWLFAPAVYADVFV